MTTILFYSNKKRYKHKPIIGDISPDKPYFLLLKEYKKYYVIIKQIEITHREYYLCR